jgi:hypothetical protein
MTRKASCNCGKLSLTYEGPDPDRISLCQCNDCQRRTGSVVSVQARLPVKHVTVEGQSKTWTVPPDSEKPAHRCDSMGGTYHFCPECGSTLYWEIDGSPDLLGVAVGGFTDPTFPPPIISGFEAYGRPWVMNISDLSMPHFDHDGTSHGGARA